MHAIAFNAGGELLADGPFSRVRGIRSTHHLAPFRDCVVPFERHHNDGSFGHEGDQATEEGPLLVHRVEALGLRLSEARFLYAENFESLALDLCENGAGLSCGYGVW